DKDKPTTATTVVISVDGVLHQMTANTARPDIGTTYPDAGSNHGFVATYKLPEGSHQVCVTVHNIGYGSNVKFSCRTAVLNFTPTPRPTTPAPPSPRVHPARV